LRLVFRFFLRFLLKWDESDDAEYDAELLELEDEELCVSLRLFSLCEWLELLLWELELELLCELESL